MPLAAIRSASPGNGRCNALASDQGAHRQFALFLGHENYRHHLGVDWCHDGVRLGGEKAVEVSRDFALSYPSGEGRLVCSGDELKSVATGRRVQHPVTMADAT